MPYFVYCQNNSGGRFVHDPEKLSYYVAIEAESISGAAAKAEELGIYFNGCDDGRDCSCCGDRWYRQSEPEELPTYVFMKWMGENPDMYVHNLDGSVDAVHLPKKSFSEVY